MSKASQIVILCEDRLHEVFVRRFLKQGWKKGSHDVRVVPYPQGGAGERHVRDKYPDELRAYRDRSTRARTVLVAVIDADTGTVQRHHEELNRACGCVQPPVDVRQNKEAVVHVIPKRHIETWLAYLDNVDVSEDCSYKSEYGFRGRESDCHGLVGRLVKACKNEERLANLPDSLIRACSEFERIKDLL